MCVCYMMGVIAVVEGVLLVHSGFGVAVVELHQCGASVGQLPHGRDPDGDCTQ